MSNEYSIPQIIEGNDQFPIFNIMNVKGYCIIYEGRRMAFVFAADIAREGGLIYEHHTPKIRKNFHDTSVVNPIQGVTAELIPATSGGNLIQGDAVESMYDTSVVQNQYYTNEEILWQRFNKYLNDTIEIAKQKNPEILQWLQLPIHPYSYIPLEFAIMILMHCRSKQALDFQWTLTSIIVPQLYEYYDQYQQSQIDYYQDMLDTDQLYSTTEIASEFTMSAQQLRQILQKDFKIIYPCNKTWQIAQHLAAYDYVRNKYNTNTPDHPYWTNSGREFIINLLTKYGYKLHEQNQRLRISMVFDNSNN